MFFALLLLLAPSVFAQCGVGSQCKTKGGDETCSTCCSPCPAGTACSQWTTSSGSLGAFYCQYTACLAEGAFCNNRVGKCCSGLDCRKTNETAVAQTCNKPTTTTTAPTTTTPLTTTTSETTTTPIEIVVETTTTTATTTTTSSSSKCMTTSGAVSGAECQFPFVFQGQVYNSCTTAGGFSQPWCSTGTNTYRQWGYCDSTCTGAESKVCVTESGATPNLPCVFPFRHWGKTYWTCTTDGDKKPWCSTKVDRYGNHQLGNWGDCNLASCMQRNDNN